MAWLASDWGGSGVTVPFSFPLLLTPGCAYEKVTRALVGLFFLDSPPRPENQFSLAKKKAPQVYVKQGRKKHALCCQINNFLLHSRSFAWEGFSNPPRTTILAPVPFKYFDLFPLAKVVLEFVSLTLR